ncbi:MAG: transglutaminase family protein [Flavobacteriaceae bacterium]|nr:transglutaminase family protein [Flavobacteriaceae bacterium]
MKTLDHSSIKALISLLEDPSEIIFNEIHQTILALGSDGISHLQEAFDDSKSELQKERIVEILDKLKLDKLEYDLNAWKEFHENDLLRGLILIARYGYPNFDEEEINKTIQDIIIAVNDKIIGKSPKEIAHILNQVILYDFGFNGNIRNYSGINNSFFNKVIEKRISNPIGLSVIYLLVAEALEIPLVGINSPGHFVLGYVSEKYFEDEDESGIMDHIEFYIDPFINGLIIEPEDYDKWLLQIPFNLEEKKYLSATNVDIIKRIMNNLIHVLFVTGEKSTAKELLAINETL